MIDKIYNLYLSVGGKISTDSRRAQGLFFALKGDKFDANLFAESALKNGAEYAIVDRIEVVKDDRFILVDDVLKTLQQLANYHRRHLSIPILAITGTNGKTTTKELVRDILKQKFNVVATNGNLNNHIGVPITLLSIDETCQFAVVEMGANHPGEIKALCNIAEPDYGMITNVGIAHLEGFGSEEGIRKTKGELYDFLEQTGGTAFYNADDTILSSMISERKRLNTIPYNIEAKTISSETGLLSFNLLGKEYSTHFVGDVNLLNISAALSIGQKFDVPFNMAIKAVTSYVPSNNRSQIIRTDKSNTLILDAYNANPSSMLLAIRNFKNFPSDDKYMILGQMNELGPKSEKLHSKIIDAALEFIPKEKLYCVGMNFKSLLPERCFDTVDSVIESFTKEPLSGKTILIKGSRTNCLEKLVDSL